jgi:hypothetical protein
MLVHGAHSVDLHGVGFNASVSNHEAQEQAGGYTEDTLGWVELPLELPHVGEGFGEVGDKLVFLGGLDDHIVYVSFNVSPDPRLQAFLYFLLICCSSVFRPKVMTL